MSKAKATIRSKIKSRRTSKKAQIEAKLASKNGATIPILVKLTGWQEHSVRAALSTLRKSGTTIVPTKLDGKPTLYRIENPSGEA